MSSLACSASSSNGVPGRAFPGRSGRAGGIFGCRVAGALSVPNHEGHGQCLHDGAQAGRTALFRGSMGMRRLLGQQDARKDGRRIGAAAMIDLAAQVVAPPAMLAILEAEGPANVAGVRLERRRRPDCRSNRRGGGKGSNPGNWTGPRPWRKARARLPPRSARRPRGSSAAPRLLRRRRIATACCNTGPALRASRPSRRAVI